MTAEPYARLHHLLLESSDLDAAVAFYTGVLGFTVRKQEAFRDGRRLVVTHQGLGLTEGGEPGGRTVDHICFAVEDVDHITSRVREAGHVVARGPGAGPYGHTVYVVDPDGNEIELVELSEETA
jgi:ureidoacrylate peracid hydrolase